MLVVACHEPPAHRLVIDEPLELCATAPYSTTLDLVQRTQWTLAIPAGDVALPDAIAVPQSGDIRGTPTSGIELAIDVVGGDPVELSQLEATVFAETDQWLRPDAEHDLLELRNWLGSPLGNGDPWLLSLELVTERGEDFRFGSATQADSTHRDLRLGCSDPEISGPCPNRVFEACDPGGPLTRTRVVLDRGDATLDLRMVPDDGGNDRAKVMFVAAELHIDGIAVVQHAFDALLVSPNDERASHASYAVLAPASLERAELGCAVVLAELGTPEQRAYTAECDLRELAPLEILAVTREQVD